MLMLVLVLMLLLMFFWAWAQIVHMPPPLVLLEVLSPGETTSGASVAVEERTEQGLLG
jgi:hypothetical protein